MKTRTAHLWMILWGALTIGVGQGCAPTAVVGDSAGSEPKPAMGADAAGTEALPPLDLTAKTEALTEPVPPDTRPVPPVTDLPVTEPSGAPRLAPARTLTDIEVQRRPNSIAVIVTGDGQLSYQITRIGGNRLVVDLADVVNGTKRKTMMVGHPLIKRIRVGSQQPPQQRVRLVMDLPRLVPYAVETSGPQLLITLSEAPQPAGPQGTLRPLSGDLDGRDGGPQSVPVALPDQVKVLEPVTSPLPAKRANQSPEGGLPDLQSHYTGRRISLDFQEAEISSVLRLIADVSGLNMVVGEGVKAKVTLKLLNVPWDQALDLILKLNQLGQVREGNIIWIDTLGNIARQKEEVTKAKDATIRAEPLMSRILYLNYAEPAKALDVVKSNLSPRGEVKTDLRTNSLIVKDIEENLIKVANIMRELDRRTFQVQIEARIVQASKSFARGLGIQWGLNSISVPAGRGGLNVNVGTTGAAFTQTSDFLVNLPATGTGASIPTSAIGLAVGKFLGTTGTLDMRLSAGESLGVTKLVSAPKVITMDHKPAKIEQGSQVPFQTVSLQGTQTTFVDASLTLNVTPHVIIFDKTIRLEIKATKNSIGPSVSTAGPTIDKKEATTEVLLRDGETTVLGGIFEETRTDNTQGLPFFNRIPFLGWLFKNEAVTVTQTELLVFVTPTIIKE
jgi:type IV pilus assembly protein PilQ